MNQITCMKKQRLWRSSSGSWTKSEMDSWRTERHESRGGVVSLPGRTVGEIFIKSRTRWLQHQGETRHRTTARSVDLLRVQMNVRNESAVGFNIHRLSGAPAAWAQESRRGQKRSEKLNNEEQMCLWAAYELLMSLCVRTRHKPKPRVATEEKK